LPLDLYTHYTLIHTLHKSSGRSSQPFGCLVLNRSPVFLRLFNCLSSRHTGDLSENLNICLVVSKIPYTWRQIVKRIGNRIASRLIINSTASTCIVCKIMESIIRDYIMSYFHNNTMSFFSQKQSGLIKSRPTAAYLHRAIAKRRRSVL